MRIDVDYTLYLVTDRSLVHSGPLEEAVEKAVCGGCTMVQLREKELAGKEFYSLAARVKKSTDMLGVPLIINDRVDIALAIDAAGVHVGQGDMPARVVRQILGTSKLLGVSVHSAKEAKQAKLDGADYVGAGAMFPTQTKADAHAVSLQELRAVRRAVNLPVVAIGGISEATIPALYGFGIDGVAVVSALLNREDVERAAKTLKKMAALCR